MRVTYNPPRGAAHNLFLHMLKQSHILVAGATGSGKSVLVNGLICTLLYRVPADVENGAQLILIDPKRTELSHYKSIPHCLCYASEPRDMIDALQTAVDVVEARYLRMERTGDRKYQGGAVYVVIEELADLMTTAKKIVVPLIQRLCQIARAANVHVIAVTQCPLVEIIPTKIKVNFDGIVALRTRNAQDSRNIIGEKGAEELPRYGECLYASPDFCNIQRVVVPYVTESEQDGLIRWWTYKKGVFRKVVGGR